MVHDAYQKKKKEKQEQEAAAEEEEEEEEEQQQQQHEEQEEEQANVTKNCYNVGKCVCYACNGCLNNLAINFLLYMMWSIMYAKLVSP